MSYLPPVGWADVTTKQDLDHLGTELRLEMARLGADLRTEIARGFAKQSRFVVSAMVGLTAIFSAIVALFTFLA